MNYSLDPKAETTATGWMDDIEVAPSRVVEVFGPPNPGSDDYKVSGEYVFRSDDGVVFVLHDWKSTSQWEDDLPSPTDFWKDHEQQELAISAVEDDVSDFKAWLWERLR